MNYKKSRSGRVITLVIVASLLASCGLPRSAPTRREILAGSVEKQGEAYIVPVDARVSALTDSVVDLGFGSEFLNAGVMGADTIQPGDVVGFRIWENVDDGLLAQAAGSAAALDQLQVDAAGYIFVPYAGRIKAAGNSPEALRRIITEKLAEQTPDPQVVVVRLPGEGASVSITGAVGGQGVYPIEKNTRTLAGMMAKAGGPNIDAEAAQITVTRGSRSGTIWFQDLYDRPEFDIALRDGDKIFVEGDPRKFVSMGATGQGLIEFDTRTISAIEALAKMGGLNAASADPTGIFVFRDEEEAVARAVLGQPDLVGTQKMVYVLDLTSPNGVFMAREFGIHDGDTVLVTEAPFVQWQKIIGSITGTLNSANTLNTAIQAVSN